MLENSDRVPVTVLQSQRWHPYIDYFVLIESNQQSRNQRYNIYNHFKQVIRSFLISDAVAGNWLAQLLMKLLKQLSYYYY